MLISIIIKEFYLYSPIVTKLDMVRIYTEDNFKSLGSLVEDRKSIYMLYDRNAEIWAKEVAESLPEGRLKASKPLDAGEDLKNLAYIEEIASWLLDNEAGRDAFVLAVGGGTVTDIAGFASSIFKRGVEFAYIPTTLLAQVDAAIGGKTGVNFGGYKNMLGTFCQPQFTYICPKVLSTLPEREFLSGSAELLKTFLISDAAMYDRAVACLSNGMNVTDPELKEMIGAAASVKAGVVERDFTEKGERKHLNLGHTFGHAIEWYEHKQKREGADILPLTHGAAVAVGMVMAANLGERLGMSPAGLEARLAKDFEACHLPVSTEIPREIMLEAVRQDKKAAGGKISFVLLEEIGKPVVRALSPEEL